jgi:hypothetical protein
MAGQSHQFNPGERVAIDGTSVASSSHVSGRNRTFAIALMALVASNAGATVITQTTTFLHAPVSAITLNSFDPSLGTLNQVEWTISGQVQIQVLTQPFLTGPVPMPTPYTFTLRLEQGLEGQGSFDVAFGFDALYLNLLGQASGAGETVVLSVPFLFHASFTASTDVTGITIPIFNGPDAVPPVFGLREDFLSTFPGISTPLIAVHELTPVFAGTTGAGVTPLIGPAAALNTALLYEYTPAATVPEPATAILLCLGLALLRARSRG